MQDKNQNTNLNNEKTKQKEIYEYRKGVKQDSAEDQKKLTEKRTEWRNWLKENNLSVKYFSGLI